MPRTLTDNKTDTYISIPARKVQEYHFRKAIAFNRAMLQENIITGQRVEEALLEYWDGNTWKEMARFTTIGYKRLLRFEEVKSDKIRFTVLKSKGMAQLSSLGFYKASSRE